MKTIKFLFFLIILGLLATIGYQNQEYFLTTSALHIDLKISSLHYTAKALPNWAFWGICFGLGLLITGLRGLFTAFRLGREIKAKDERIDSLKAEINSLQTRLDVFIHDPYIKKHLEEEETREKDVPEEKAEAEEKGEATA